MKQLVSISILLPLILWGQENRKLDESFDPTNLSDWPSSKHRTEQIKSLKEHFASIGGSSDAVEIVEYLDHVFRVQLSSTRDYDQASALAEQASGLFEEDVIIQFDSPYYKIRVGKMNSREEAQSLQQIAMNNGYRRAWVIRSENTPTENN